MLKQEEDWEYEIPQTNSEVATIGIGLDGTCMPMGERNWREAMCGTFSLYDKSGDRIQTIYIYLMPQNTGKRALK